MAEYCTRHPSWQYWEPRFIKERNYFHCVYWDSEYWLNIFLKIFQYSPAVSPIKWNIKSSYSHIEFSTLLTSDRPKISNFIFFIESYSSSSSVWEKMLLFVCYYPKWFLWRVILGEVIASCFFWSWRGVKLWLLFTLSPFFHVF